MFSDDDDDLIFVGESSLTAIQSVPASQSSLKASKTKIVPKKHRSSGWVQSSFDDFFTATPSPRRSGAGGEHGSRKRPSEAADGTGTGTGTGGTGSTVKDRKIAWKRIQVEDELWYQRHTPKNRAELAVHKKKTDEVESWLRTNVGFKDGQRAPILLLTGPAGCGKTACLRWVARELGVDVSEWINPVSITDRDIYDQDALRQEYSSVAGYQTKSQLAQFGEFLLRANKYPTLQIFGDEVMKKKVVLVEDFPNVFFRDTSVFHDILRRYRQTGRCPLVFIITDSAGGDSNERTLFPRDVQAELGVHQINFNPVAPTVMTKVLERIAIVEARQGGRCFTPPSKAVIEGLAAACSGDIRGAINALQFACLVDTSDLTGLCKITSKTSKSKSSQKVTKPGTKDVNKRSRAADPSGIGGKDASIFLFRALGKILYCKREEDSSCDIKLPSHLLHHHRPPLAFNPEEVVERSCMPSELFNDYLHQNYLDFYPSLSDVVRASQYLSTADSLTHNWATRSVMSQYASSVATRGLLHANTGRLAGAAGGHAWKPLHKPQWYDTRRKMQSNMAAARDLFRTWGLPPRDVQTQLVPYLSIINAPLRNTAQIHLVNTLARFTQHNRASTSDRLGETDVTSLTSDRHDDDVTIVESGGGRAVLYGGADVEDSEDGLSASQRNVCPPQEDEYSIEEFED